MKEIYQILSGDIGQEERLTQIANNLANVSTVGYKKDGITFQSYLKSSMNAMQTQSAPGLQNGSANPSSPSWPTLGSSYVDFQPGSLQKSGNTLDVALTGAGFFRVEMPGEKSTYLTRAGNFSVNNKGELVTANNRRVLDRNGKPITLNLSVDQPQIVEDGTIMMKGSSVANIGVFTTADLTKLEKHGETLFKVPDSVTVQAVAKPHLRQGMLESSNVNAIEEMVNMIQVQRSNDVSQKVIQQFDDLTSKRIDAANSQ